MDVTVRGKSSFVDAIEYVLHDGRIEHLAHEYSGKRQEKAVLNTHKPRDRDTELIFKFKDGSELKVLIAKDGSFTHTGADAVALPTWEYRRTVLRQHEVAMFIHSTKGEKYSALLPLLGLGTMELAAENLRHLSRAIEEESRIKEERSYLKQVETERKATFGADSDDQILTKINDLYTKYCPEKPGTEDKLLCCRDLKIANDTRIMESSVDQRRYVALKDAATIHLQGHIEVVRAASGKLAGIVEPLIIEKLEVLQSTHMFVDKLGDEEEIQCPACGRSISARLFQKHVESERERLHDIIESFNTRKAAIGTLCSTLRSLQSILSKVDLKSWRDELTKGQLAENFIYLDGIDTEDLRTSCGEDVLRVLEKNLEPLINAAISSSKDAPPDA